jgi:hypothetical protein
VRSTRIVVGAATAAVLLSTTLHAPPAGAEPTSIAGRQWHYRAQIDGRDGKDRITITAQPGFTLDGGWGNGQVLVHVDFDGGTRFAEIRQDVSYYSARTPWTPWLGATNLDRRGGKEIVLGFSTGAHAQLFDAYGYASDGELLSVEAPRHSGSWMVNSSYGTGTSGWRCTRHGIQSRAVSASGGPRATVRIVSYVMGRNGWRRTKRVVRTVATDADGNPPRSTARFARFACPGLPRSVL